MLVLLPVSGILRALGRAGGPLCSESETRCEVVAGGGTMATGARGRNVEMVESDRAAIVRALADEDALRVFAQVVAVTGTGLPERSGGSIGYVTAYGVSRQTGLPVSVVLGAGRRLTEARLTIAGADGASWRTDFESLCHAADAEPGATPPSISANTRAA